MNDSKMHFNLLSVMDTAANTMKVRGTLSRLLQMAKLMLFCGDISQEIEATA